MEDPIHSLALGDGRYSPEAFRFLFESLEAAIRLAGKDSQKGADRHVTGHEVLAGMQEHARQMFGPLAGQVWRAWGVERAVDWGHIVFLLVDAGLLSSQETDSLEDFRVELDFDEEFREGYRPELPLI